MNRIMNLECIFLWGMRMKIEFSVEIRDVVIILYYFFDA